MKDEKKQNTTQKMINRHDNVFLKLQKERISHKNKKKPKQKIILEKRRYMKNNIY